MAQTDRVAAPRLDLLLGRRTYDAWSGFWPKAPSSPMADRLNAARKFVAAHRPDEAARFYAARFPDSGVTAVHGLRLTIRTARRAMS